jgi:hypothetical protein
MLRCVADKEIEASHQPVQFLRTGTVSRTRSFASPYSSSLAFTASTNPGVKITNQSPRASATLADIDGQSLVGMFP